MKHFCMVAVPAVLGIVLVSTQVFGDGVHIGRSPAGQLLVEIEPAFAGVNVLPPIVPGGLFEGWSATDPGFIDLVDVDAPPAFLPLEPGASIWLEAVSIDPAFKVIGTDFRILQVPGDDTFLGSSNVLFDVHPTYLIDSVDPMFDPMQTLWVGSFVLRDDGVTGYTPSAPFMLSFTNVLPTGDMNCDGVLDGLDIAAFVQAVLDPAGYFAAFPICDINLGDMNADGFVDVGDVSFFAAALLGP